MRNSFFQWMGVLLIASGCVASDVTDTTPSGAADGVMLPESCSGALLCVSLQNPRGVISKLVVQENGDYTLTAGLYQYTGRLTAEDLAGLKSNRQDGANVTDFISSTCDAGIGFGNRPASLAYAYPSSPQQIINESNVVGTVFVGLTQERGYHSYLVQSVVGVSPEFRLIYSLSSWRAPIVQKINALLVTLGHGNSALVPTFADNLPNRTQYCNPDCNHFLTENLCNR